MNCFDTILAYTNTHTNFVWNLKVKNFQKISVKFMRMSNCINDFYMFLCLSTHGYASHGLCILAKFRVFLKPVTVQENTCYTCRSYFDIYHNLMFEASFGLEPCFFSFLLLKHYKHQH